MIRKVKNTILWTYIISDINEEEIVGTSYEKRLQKTNQKEFRVDGDIDKTVGLIKKNQYEWIFFRMEIFRRKSETWIR